MKIVELLVLSGAMPSSVAITVDVLATANRLRAARGRPPAFALRMAGSGARTARAVAGDLVPSPPSPTKGDADIVIVPSLVTVTEAAVTERLTRRDAAVAQRAIERAAARGAHVAASCSAVFLVASTGILDGRRATTTWWLAPLFQRMYPNVQLDADEMVIGDRAITTAGAAMAQLDLMLALIARYCGGDLASRCARFLLLDGRRSQSRYMALAFLAATDPDVARAERWARAELATGLTVDALASAAGLAPRTFARRVARATGLSPIQFLQRLRVERAVELLETTTLSVEAIARHVGYAEPTTLRRLLRRETGGPPRELRGA
ncbi:MAG: helix-turn-helix domain-containing protein [Gemmatimonadaceae bacterium]